MIDYIAAVDRETRRLLDAARTTAVGADVPSCAGWSVGDLLWHLTEVQAFWGTVVAERMTDPDGYVEPQRPSDADLIDALDSARRSLVGALAGSEPDTPCWTWSDEQTAGFVRRRQAHEALIHRVDAELAAGDLSPLDAELAEDGIDEVLRIMIGGVPDWASFTSTGETIQIDTGPRRWGLVLGRMTGTSPNTGKYYDVDAATIVDDIASPNTIIRGAPEDLDLWLWGRGPVDRLETEGDPDIVGRLRTMAAEATQ